MEKLILGLSSIIILIYWVNWHSDSNIINRLNGVNHKYNNTQFINDIIIHPANKTCINRSFVIILVTSYVGNVKLRRAHRRAMPKILLDSMKVSRIFLLAKIPPQEEYISQNAVKDESRAFGDILQGAFIENYHNLTFKHLMGLQWASTNCSGASYILKVDDDTVFSLERTFKLLKSIKRKEDFFMGYMLNNMKPIRETDNYKWYVSSEEYPGNEYPPYLSGWYYITTPNSARRIINKSKHHPYFRIDDLLITGLLTEALHIKLLNLPQGFWLENNELLGCCLRDMIKEKIMCDAAVGTNGGRNNLIVKFNEALSFCWRTKKCTARTKEQALEECVSYKLAKWFPNFSST